MHPFELFTEDQKPTGVFCCGSCWTVKQNRAQAERCCEQQNCSRCGVVLPHSTWRTMCDCCAQAEEIKRERERFEAALKIDTSDEIWSGWIYSEGLGSQEGFFENLDSLVEWCDENDEAMPEYVWTCDPYAFCKLDFQGLLGSCMEDAYEDFETDQIKGQVELRQAVEAFNQANVENVSWIINYGRALVVPKEKRKVRVQESGIAAQA